MAITLKQKEKFIDLRSDGLSYESTAKKIGISKSSCLSLGTELEREVNNAVYLKLQSIVEKHKLNKIQKVESHLALLQKTIAEITERDLSKLSIKELLALKESLENSSNKELEIKYITDETVLDELNFFNKIPKTLEL